MSCIFFPAYPPSYGKLDWIDEQNYELMFPDKMLKVPPKAAIVRRNEYVIQHADYIICYVNHISGGAYQAMQKALKYGKKIINLAEYI